MRSGSPASSLQTWRSLPLPPSALQGVWLATVLLLLTSSSALAAGLPVAVPATPVQDSEASMVTSISTQPAAAAASQPRQKGETAEQRRARKQGVRQAQVSCQDRSIQQTCP